MSMLVPQMEQGILEHTLDCLPWSSMSWSIHRGLRDILVTYAKPTMNKFRQALASALCDFINEHPQQFEANRWSREFVRKAMAKIAANSVLAGSGNSGDSVRVVTDAALLLSAKDLSALDETDFGEKNATLWLKSPCSQRMQFWHLRNPLYWNGVSSLITRCIMTYPRDCYFASFGCMCSFLAVSTYIFHFRKLVAIKIHLQQQKADNSSCVHAKKSFSAKMIHCVPSRVLYPRNAYRSSVVRRA